MITELRRRERQSIGRDSRGQTVPQEQGANMTVHEILRCQVAQMVEIYWREEWRLGPVDRQLGEGVVPREVGTNSTYYAPLSASDILPIRPRSPAQESSHRQHRALLFRESEMLNCRKKHKGKREIPTAIEERRLNGEFVESARRHNIGQPMKSLAGVLS